MPPLQHGTLRDCQYEAIEALEYEATDELIDEACAPIEDPEVRNMIHEVRQPSYVTIDDISQDEVTGVEHETPASASGAHDRIDSFEAFIEENRDEIDAAGRVLRLSVEGTSTHRGRKPDWMTDSTQFLVTGLQEGSTICPIQAPLLKETAEEAVQQQDFWRSKSNGKWTALTLLGDALADVSADDRESPRYDSGVLSAIATFSRVIENGETIRIRNKNTGEVAFNIDRTHIQQAQRLKRETPPPFSAVLTGKLDVIEHSQRSFKLLTEEGDTIHGALD